MQEDLNKLLSCTQDGNAVQRFARLCILVVEMNGTIINLIPQFLMKLHKRRTCDHYLGPEGIPAMLKANKILDVINRSRTLDRL